MVDAGPAWNVTCPTCSNQMGVVPELIGQPIQCPTCKSVVRVHFFCEPEPTDRANDEPAASSSMPPAPGHRPPPRTNQAAPRRDTSSPFFTRRNGAGDTVNEEPTPNDTTAAPPPNGDESNLSELRLPELSISPRRLRPVLYYGLWLGPLAFILMTQPKSWPAFLFLVGWFFGGWWCAARLTFITLRALYPTLRCPHCHERYSATARWQCSCGFMPHRPINVFTNRCPKCGDRTGYVNCERCETTIML